MSAAAKTIRTYISVDNLRYLVKVASQDRTCVKDCTIPKGETYYLFYTKDEKNVLHRKGIYCKAHTKHCDNCGAAMPGDEFETKRFCSEGCAERHYQKECIGVEEKEFWGGD